MSGTGRTEIAPRHLFGSGLCRSTLKMRACAALGRRAVPRYYFLIHASDHKEDDPDGTDLPNHQAAHHYAHRIIRELKEAAYHPSGATMIVLDRAGNTIRSIPF